MCVQYSSAHGYRYSQFIHYINLWPHLHNMCTLLYKFCVSSFNFHATTCHDYDLAFPVVLVPVLPVAGFESGGVNVG